MCVWGGGSDDKQLFSSIRIFGQPGGKKRSHRKGKAIRLQDSVLEYHGEMGRDYDTLKNPNPWGKCF